MGRRKGSLSHRRNEQSPYHKRRAEERRNARMKVQAEVPPVIQSGRNSADFQGPPSRGGLRVLSLFDGISTLLQSLDMMHLHVESYFSSEIDPQALQVQRHRFGDRITRLGCVKSITDEVLETLGEIDLLVGGSPCDQLSLVNWRRKGLKDPSSSGSLFYEYVRIKKFLSKKAEATGRQFFWLLENTYHMEVSNKEEMSRAIGCIPVTRDVLGLLPVNRKRCFWGNVISMPRASSSSPICVKHLQDILKPQYKANVKCLPTLTTSPASQKSGKMKILPVVEDGVARPLFITEIEMLFGLPESFTDGPNLSISSRRKLLGKAFCVPVIQDLLAPLRDIFLVTGSEC